MRGQLEDAEGDLRHAQRQVEKAVAPILAAEVDRICGEAEALRDELDGARAILNFLQGALPARAPQRARIAMALPSPPPGFRGPTMTVTRRWRPGAMLAPP